VRLADLSALTRPGAYRLHVDGAADSPRFVVGADPYNPGRQDAQGRREPYASTAPALSCLDADSAFASNEVAINWNAPLAYVSAALATLTPPSR